MRLCRSAKLNLTGTATMRTSALATLAAVTLFQAPAFAAQHMQFIDTDETLITHIGPKGDAPGDVMTFKGVITEVDGKKKVGTEQGFCIRIDVAAKSWECAFTVVLAAGQ